VQLDVSRTPLSADTILGASSPRWPREVAQGDCAYQQLFIPKTHALRPGAEQCITEAYARKFSAGQLVFPDMLLALRRDDGAIVCAAGLRTADEGFFSELYLDEPIERLLSRHAGSAVPRDAIFEVTTLASKSASASSLFIRQIAGIGEAAGFNWSFFTATARLQKLLACIGIRTIELCDADPVRVAGLGDWGSYYTHSPTVCAVNSNWLDGPDMKSVGDSDA
jgi:hypothetical protein